MYITPFSAPPVAATAPVGRTGVVAARIAPEDNDADRQKTAERKQARVEEVVRVMNDVLQPLGITLEFSRDEATRAVVVRVKDQASGETLRQIPSEAMLRLSAALGDLQGNLFDHTA